MMLHVWPFWLGRTASWRHPAGISIQTGFIGSEETNGGGSRELGVCDVPVFDTEAVQTHCEQPNDKTTPSTVIALIQEYSVITQETQRLDFSKMVK